MPTAKEFTITMDDRPGTLGKICLPGRRTRPDASYAEKMNPRALRRSQAWLNQAKRYDETNSAHSRCEFVLLRTQDLFQRRHPLGRPSVSQEIVDLIRKVSQANPRWGAPRIHGELLKLGFELSEATVAKYIVWQRKPPSQTWRTFLANHAKDLVSSDFFVVPTVFFRVLFVFVILSHDRRRPIHAAVTEYPTVEWVAHELLEASGTSQTVWPE